MTELEYVLSRFEDNFKTFRGKRIALHGSREYAREIIRRFDSAFHFVGVMTRDPLEKPVFCGLPVLREEDIPQLEIDMLLLTERVKYAEAVYTDLDPVCREKGIEIYDMYGLDERETHRQILACRPLNADRWKDLSSGYDVLAFEVMDTLLIPTIFSPDWIIRPSFRPMIESFLSQGATVLLSLRKSCPEEEQIRYLKKEGLFDDLETRLVRRKGEDLSFRAMREMYPGKKILYIGTGLINECILPRYYGIDTYRNVTFDCLAPTVEAAPSPTPYDRDLPARIRAAIRESDLVSFDIFDTLLLRRTLRPEDIFALTERRGLQRGLPVKNFARVRISAARESRGADIYGIYDLLAGSQGWSAEERAEILALELETERSVIRPRREIVALLEFAREEGKRVVLTSDMYLPGPILEGLLQENGICGYERLFISCEEKKFKRTGLFEEVVRLAGPGKRILHIGDDRAADEWNSIAFGIESVILPSALTLAGERGWIRAINAASTLSERCLVGSAIAELFSDPFQDSDLRARPTEERLRRFAVGVVGPLMAGHTAWLLRQLAEERFDGVLFLSRDGYLPSLLYETLAASISLPPAVYFYASRHSTFLLCADNENYFARMCESALSYHGLSARETLFRLFELREDQLLAQEEGESDLDYCLRHRPLIENVVRDSREGYRVYSRRCGLRPGGRYAVVDLIATGTTQFFLSQALPFSLCGFYYGCYSHDARICPDISDYLSGNNETLMNNYIELESFITSTEPSVDRVSPSGEVVFAPEVRTEEELREIDLVHRDALRFAKEYFASFYAPGEEISSAVPEEMFAAEGYHWVQHSAYDDWIRKRIASRQWQSGGK